MYIKQQKNSIEILKGRKAVKNIPNNMFKKNENKIRESKFVNSQINQYNLDCFANIGDYLQGFKNKNFSKDDVKA